MHITELEIDNFKSFSKKTKIPFLEGFTVISGPNGSGKSNIIDSILFVLALSSSRNLRAEKLTDLINLNSGKNIAEVAIAFSDGTKIRRRIKRTGNGYYSYNYLNDRLCKQGDIVDHLAKFGIIPHGYNVVMQGDVTRIMEMSDFERRKIIDEIAGVSEFDTKKQQSLSELDVVRERIEREELLLIELAKRAHELKKEREHALEYQKWQKELAFFQGCRSAAQLHAKEKERLTLLSSAEEQKIRISRIEADRGIEENELAYLKADLADVDDLINKKSGPDYLKLIADLEEAKSGIKLAEQTIGRLKKDKEANLEGINRVFADTKRAEARVAELSDQIRTLSIDRTNIAMEVATAKAQVEKIETEIRRYSSDTEVARQQLFALMEEAEAKKGERSAILHQQDILIEKSRMRTSELERLTTLQKQLDEEFAVKQAQLEENERTIGDLSGRKKELDRNLSELESTLFAHRSSLERLRGEMKDAEQDAIRLEAAQQARGESGGKAIEAVKAIEGVHGTIMELGRAPPEYTTALNVAAGNKIQFVVCDTDQIATDAIRYLKDERLGRVTFLPLNKLKPPQLPPLKEPGIIDYAVNLLDYDPVYDKAFAIALGATVVVDTLERARKLIGKYRIVTLEGELLEKSGAMTGGSSRKPAKGFGAAVDDEIVRIRSRLAELSGEAATLEAAVKRMTEEVDGKRAQRGEIDQDLARAGAITGEYTRRFEAITVEKQTIEAAVARQKEETGTSAAELATLEGELFAVTEAINAVTAKLDGIKKKLDDTNIPALTDQMEKKKKEIEEAERRLRNKEADMNDASRERQHFNARIGELAEERARFDERNRQIDAEVAASNDQIASYRSVISGLEEKQKEFSGELDELRKKRAGISESIHASETKLIKFDSDKERFTIQLAALEERAQALTNEIASLVAIVGEVTTDLTLTEIEGKIADAELALHKIGAVNMLAIEEYEKIQRQVEERTERKETLSKERANLIERIEKYEQMKFEAFMTAFKAIDTNFREIFARLTSGSGNLVLENEEDPFTGGLTFAVKPRDKKVHLLSSLSGGEKSLTTLAFIFSIQHHIPAPFYAFDEVDMSLDGANVERIANMIQELAPSSQFVIVSLRKPMIEAAQRIMGVTSRPDKSTLVTGVKVHG
ncbi:chromosome segregation protein SMC [Methanoregula sp.]|uniref:chromosome segregation protein SMC n=1 Tax=Methanoregula sp. TaxID=2052170 RepID=UPI002D1ADAC7|nr:chromosome segregation protein SMC [Methanoregula sp.]HVP97536.1 chromosome segregation protein SMC [Methanoregula sp.]